MIERLKEALEAAKLDLEESETAENMAVAERERRAEVYREMDLAHREMGERLERLRASHRDSVRETARRSAQTAADRARVEELERVIGAIEAGQPILDALSKPEPKANSSK